MKPTRWQRLLKYWTYSLRHAPSREVVDALEMVVLTLALVVVVAWMR